MVRAKEQLSIYNNLSQQIQYENHPLIRDACIPAFQFAAQKFAGMFYDSSRLMAPYNHF